MTVEKEKKFFFLLSQKILSKRFYPFSTPFSYLSPIVFYSCGLKIRSFENTNTDRHRHIVCLLPVLYLCIDDCSLWITFDCILTQSSPLTISLSLLSWGSLIFFSLLSFFYHKSEKSGTTEPNLVESSLKKLVAHPCFNQVLIIFSSTTKILSGIHQTTLISKRTRGNETGLTIVL